MRIFISYRRSDTQNLAGRIADRLSPVDGISDVFLDVNGTAKGMDYIANTDQVLANSDVCIVLMGENWLAIQDNGLSRLFNPDDLVLDEVKSAISCGKRVIPVLANGATIPAAADLPNDISMLSRLNAATLSHISFERDIDELTSIVLEEPNYQRKTSLWKKFTSRILPSLLGVLASIIFIFLGALVSNSITGKPLASVFGGTPALAAALLTLLLLGAILPVIYRRRK